MRLPTSWCLTALPSFRVKADSVLVPHPPAEGHQMSRRDGDVYLNIKFTARRYQLLKWISEELRIPLSEAVAFALIHRLVPLARGVKFFKNRIEPAPGSRLASEDIWNRLHRMVQFAPHGRSNRRERLRASWASRYATSKRYPSGCAATKSFAWTFVCGTQGSCPHPSRRLRNLRSWLLFRDHWTEAFSIKSNVLPIELTPT